MTSKLFVAGMRWLLPILLIGSGLLVYRDTNPIAYALPVSILNSKDAAYDAIISASIKANDPFARPGEHPAATLRHELRSLKSTSPLFYVGKRKTPGDLAVRLVVSGLAWPRRVFTPGCEGDSGGDYPPEGVKSDIAIYFDARPVEEAGQLILPEVRLVKSQEPKVWNSYCPR